MNSTSQPLVSVVTPLYNNAEYLGQCIESVLAQTYEEWDYTIVNNCSTDGSGEVASSYAARDSRIRVVSNDVFLRAIANHNVALRQSSPFSKYCKVVFADDWIFPQCIEQMVAVAEEHPSVGIVGAYGLEGPQVMWTGLPYPSTVVSGREVCRWLFLEGLYVFGTATSLLYRADLVRSHDPFYDEGNLHADMETCVALLKTCDFGFVHQVLTFSRLREESLRTVSAQLNTYSTGGLINLVRHGLDFLTEDEFELCVSRKLDEYYGNLAGGLVRGCNKVFWEYHKKKLTEAGVGFSRLRLARVVLAKLVDAALNPKHGVDKVLQVASEALARRSSTQVRNSPTKRRQ